MPRLKPSVLLIGVFVCVPLLVVHRLNLFLELGIGLEQTYQRYFGAADLQVWPFLQYGWHTFAAFLAAWMGIELPKQFQRIAFLFGFSFLTLLLSPVLALQGILFEPFSGIIATFAAGLSALLVSGSERGRREHQFRHFFVGRLDTQSFSQLIHHHEPVRLTSKRDLTSLSCRIVNQSQLAVSMEAQDLEQMTSAFLKAMSDFLVGRGAYLDVCNSYGLTVQFGFPCASNDHAAQACSVALELSRFSGELVAELEKRWNRRPLVGVGICTGPAICGLIGHSGFQFYSALGEPPEMSRRLCNMNALYGSRITIAASTFSSVKTSYEVRPLEMIAAPGQSALREVYELLGEKGSLSTEQAASRDAFWEGVVALRQGDPEAALVKLKKAVLDDQNDPPLKYLMQRAEQMKKEGLRSVGSSS